MPLEWSGGTGCRSDNVIWVVGAQKIIPTLEDGLARIRGQVLPLEDKRMKGPGHPGSAIGKMLIFERNAMPNRRIDLILVNEVLGVLRPSTR